MKFAAVCLLIAFASIASALPSDNSTDVPHPHPGANRQDRQARYDERKYRYDQDKKEISTFLNTKNILRTLVKLLFGNNEESAATSRQVLNVLVKVRYS